MDEIKLTPADFTPFFKAIWGFDPFPWQQRLLNRLASSEDIENNRNGEPGRWPSVLDLPTGAGKTAALDIALFHLALEAASGSLRRAPVRIAFVVDRRLIVDDAYERARVLAAALLKAIEEPTAADPVVLKVAQTLCHLAGVGQAPLLVRRLRGGAPREDDWARTPVQPTILCSTVDQVGSRLLFRGYGVSDRMKPIHAGLLGSDCLLLLDEAHLSEPFRQTLKAISRLRAPDQAPFGFALLTATPNVDREQSFGLNSDDRAHPVLSARIAAPKPARLKEIAGKPGVESETHRVEEVVAAAQAILEPLQNSRATQPVVGVVVNRV
ncbi:MAG: hypothetical protein ACREET_05470, partial [Stellaceae bacterium]